MSLPQWPLQGLASYESALLLLLGLALLVSAIGFRRAVYFISIGYAFSIVSMAVVSPILYGENLTWASALQNAALVVWGLRLGVYLLRRESRPSYQKRIRETYERTDAYSLGRKVLIWAGVSILYVLMFSSSLLTLAVPTTAPLWWLTATRAIGLLLMSGGIGLEATADRQKATFKARLPDRFCDVGVYRWVRCPNYLGEITFWAGNWVTGLASYTSLLGWVTSLAGLVCIVLIMIGSTKRLEQSQGARYGHMPEYVAYTHTVPVLFPFLPIYTFEKIRVYLG